IGHMTVWMWRLLDWYGLRSCGVSVSATTRSFIVSPLLRPKVDSGETVDRECVDIELETGDARGVGRSAGLVEQEHGRRIGDGQSLNLLVERGTGRGVRGRARLLEERVDLRVAVAGQIVGGAAAEYGSQENFRVSEN